MLTMPIPDSAVLARRDEIAARDGVWLVSGTSPAEVPGWSTTELYVGDALLDHDNAQVTAWLSRLLR